MLSVPFVADKTRVHLESMQGISGSDYINASFINVSVSDFLNKSDFAYLYLQLKCS